MIFYGTNLGVLRSWITAHKVAGDTILLPFGLTAEELTTITAASSASLHHWSALATPLVRPRPGLLFALHHDREDEIYGFIYDTRTTESCDTLDRLAGALNQLVLDSWCHAVRTGEKLDRFELDQDDALAVANLSPSMLQEWSKLPIALAVPKPGLIGALQRDDRGMLLAFAKGWEEDDEPKPAAGNQRARSAAHAAKR